MAWTTPSTVTTGQLMTAAIWNQQVRDNFGATGVATVTTAGDTTYATGANALARRAIGTTGQVMAVVAGVPNWAALSSVLGGPVVTALSSAQTVASSTTLVDTVMTFAIAASEVWAFQAMLDITGGSGIGYRIGINGPTIGAGSIRVGASGLAFPVAGNQATVTAYGTVITSSGAGTQNAWNVWGRIANGVTSGNVTVQMANGAAAGTTTLASGVMVAYRIS